MKKGIRILIADDHTVVRQGLRIMLEPKQDFELIGEAKNGKDLIEKIKDLSPDLIILDLVMPVMDGIEVIQKIRSSSSDIKILVLTSFSDEKMVIKAMKSGANGYILKESSPEELIQAINSVMRGEMWIYPNLTPKILQSLIHPEKSRETSEKLTNKELEVVSQVALGKSNAEIASTQGINESTVRFHLSNIYAKLHLKNRTQVALYALREGISDLNV